MRGAALPVLGLLAACAAAPVAPPAARPSRASGAALEAPAAAAEPETWDRELPAGAFLGDDGGEGRWGYQPVRVVDDRTESPIAGARVSVYDEADRPLPGVFAPVQAPLTDRDGWALVDLDDMRSWIYFEAPGYGPASHFGGCPEELRLRRGRDAVVEIRDVRNRPLAGASLEYVLGCGHAPEVRTLMTDAAGRAHFTCIDPEEGDFWLRAPGVTGRNEGYGGGFRSLPRLPNGHYLLHADPGPVAEGRVLDAAGRPVAGAWVGTRESHRGPWTRTDAEGRYALLGMLPGERILVEGDPPSGDDPPPYFDYTPVPGIAAVLRLPLPGMDMEPPDDAWPRLRVFVSTPEQPPPTEDLDLLLFREGEGIGERHRAPWTDDVATVEIPVRPGRWHVRAGSPAGRFRPVEAIAEVGEDGAAAVLVLEENPRWTPRIRLPGKEDGGGEVRAILIATETSEVEAEGVPGLPGTIFVPAAEPFRVHVRTSDGEARAWFEAPPAEDASPIEPTRDWMEEEEEEPAPVARIPEETITVLRPDGGPAGGADWDSLRIGAADGSNGGAGTLDTEGRVRWDFRPGDRIRIELDSAEDGGVPVLRAPLRATLEGPGPWTLRWPRGSLELRVRDAAGRPLPYATVLDGKNRHSTGEAGTIRWEGLPPGPFRLWVGAEGHRTRDLRLVLKEGERGTVEIVLRPR